MNLLQNNELIGPLAGNADDKVQAGVPPVNEFVLPLLDNVAHLGRPGEDVGGDVAEDPALVGFGVGREEFGQADLALSGHEDDEIPSDGLHGCFEVVEVHFPCVLLAAAPINISGYRPTFLGKKQQIDGKNWVCQCERSPQKGSAEKTKRSTPTQCNTRNNAMHQPTGNWHGTVLDVLDRLLVVTYVHVAYM